MKLVACIICLAATLSIAAAGPGRHKPDTAKPERKPAKAVAVAKSIKPGQKAEVLTGSYIARSYRKDGCITDGPSQVIVLDEEAIRQSGATTVAELLARRGLRR